MRSVELELFGNFADAVNSDLCALGATLRVDRRPPQQASMMTLINATGRRLGELPDSTEAASIFAFEKILIAEKNGAATT